METELVQLPAEEIIRPLQLLQRAPRVVQRLQDKQILQLRQGIGVPL